MPTDEPEEDDAAAASRSFWCRLPRAFYWTAGGVIACGGAITARIVADALHPDDRYLAWLGGSGLIFIGVAVLSLGTNAHLRSDRADKLSWIVLLSGGGWSG